MDAHQLRTLNKFMDQLRSIAPTPMTNATLRQNTQSPTTTDESDNQTPSHTPATPATNVKDEWPRREDGFPLAPNVKSIEERAEKWARWWDEVDEWHEGK